MAIWGAFTNSVTAMNAQSRALSTVSQNIANVNTDGYKRTDSRFATLLSESMGPLDIFSVKNADRQEVDVAGTISESSEWSDMAISGQGMFILNTAADGSGQTLFSRSGNFDVVDGGSTDHSYLVDKNGYYLQGWNATDDGTISSAGSVASLFYDQDAAVDAIATTRLSVVGNVASNATEATDLAAYVYDTAGNDSALTMRWTPTGTANQWTLSFVVEGGTSASTATIDFDTTGIIAAASSTVTADVTWDGGTTSAITLDLSKMTQKYGDTAIDSYDQDGYPSGALTDVSVTAYGEIVGSYSNGLQRGMGKVALARHVSPNNLEEQAGNVYSGTTAAGKASIVSLGETWNSSTISDYSLEGSNVDLADEFTVMIKTQQAYNSAAQVFQTADDMTKLAKDLKA